MLNGTHTHSLDEKMRLTIPSKLRKAIQEDGVQFVVARSARKQLSLYPMKKWQEVVAKINALESKSKAGMRRRIISQSAVLKFDSNGRILIPQQLRDVAGLTGDVTIAGSGEYLELWDAQDWLDQLERDEDELDLDALEAIL